MALYMNLRRDSRFADIRKFLRDFSPIHEPLYAPKHGENIFSFEAQNTKLQFHGTGLGDLMIIRQVGQAYQDYISENGDPHLGKVVVASGGNEPAFDPEKGDINCFWWWSFGLMADNPEDFFATYLEHVSVQPDLVLCLSKRCQKIAEEHGIESLYLPLGTYAFEPLNQSRSGTGYAGSKRHKKEEQIERLFGAYRDNPGFEWVDHFVTPTQLNLWYNTKITTFGLTLDSQREYGMVNNRVFETLASATPLILEPHPNVNEVLGFNYPYQPSNAEEAQAMVTDLRNNPEETRTEFKRISTRIRNNHSYSNRLETLFDRLEDFR
jgi:hypothetical protein